MLGGQVFKTEWWRFYPTLSNVTFEYLFVTADTAMKIKEANDLSVICLWGVVKQSRDLYLIDMIRGKGEAPDLEKQMLLFWNKWKDGVNHSRIRSLYIEDKASGTGLIQSVRRRGFIPITPVKPEKDKLQRAFDAVPYIEQGSVYLPINAEVDISREVIRECEEFTMDDSHAHDDICFVGTTMIATKKGRKELKDIVVGDEVLTPFGYSKVIRTSNREADVITNIGLTGTEDHKVFSWHDNKFDKLKNLKYNHASILNFKELLKWKAIELYGLMELNIVDIKRKDITLVIKKLKENKLNPDFIEIFGNFILERKYLKAIKFITKIIIGIITNIQILNVYHAKNILKNIENLEEMFGKDQKCKKRMQEEERDVKNGIIQKMVKNGIASIKKIISQKFSLKKYALNAEKSSTRLTTQDIKQCAENVEIEYCTEKLDKEKRTVYNITVEKGCYYANNILVSNCDNVTYAIDIAYRKSPMRINPDELLKLNNPYI